MVRLVGVVVLLVGLCPVASHAARISVTPRVALLDRDVTIRVTGVAPGARVRIEAVQPGRPRGTLTGVRTFRADAHGHVDPGGAAMLLFGTMVGSQSAYPDLRKPVSLRALVGGKTVAATTLRRLVKAPGVRMRKTTLARDGFVGDYFTPPKSAAWKTPVLLFGGSDGGLTGGLEAALLASHGFPTLTIAYFGAPGLPQSLVRIPLEYFVTAIRWLGRQPGVDAKRLVVSGASRGSEAALLLGADFPQLVHGVVALAPSSVVNGGLPASGRAQVPAWTLRGRAIAFSRTHAPRDAAAAIPVERIRGPIFLAAGVSDGLWPSWSYEQAIVARLHAHGKRDVTALAWPQAGHNVAFPVPNLTTESTVQSRYGPLYLGGSPAADAAARAQEWPRLLRFLADV